MQVWGTKSHVYNLFAEVKRKNFQVWLAPSGVEKRSRALFRTKAPQLWLLSVRFSDPEGQCLSIVLVLCGISGL